MKKYISFALFLLVGITVGLFIGIGIAHFNGKETDISFIEIIEMAFAVFVSLLAGTIINIILHEAGHLIFGLMTGYHFLSFRIFNLLFLKDKEGYKFKHFGVAGTMGQCLMLLPKRDDVPYFWYNIGGILMNFAVAALSMIILYRFDMSPTANMFWFTLLICAIIFLLVNGIPMTSNGNPNDGMNILTLLRHPEERICFSNMLNINAYQTYGKRLSEMPEEWFVSNPLTDNPSLMQLSARNITYSLLMDELKFDEARQITEEFARVSAKIPKLFIMEVNSDRLLIELATKDREEVVTKLATAEEMTYIREYSKYSAMKCATLFAYELCCQNNRDKALEHYNQVTENADRFVSQGEVKTAISIMNYIIEH